MAPQCEAVANPDSVWPPFCPSLPAAYAFTVLFGLIVVAHVVQAFLHRKPYSWVIIVSAVLQTATYVFRVLSIRDVTNVNWYTQWFIWMLVAPIWTNAYAYMVMGRMVYNFTPSASVFKIKAWRLGMFFVLLDILAFLVQVGGAVVASGEDIPDDRIMLGLHIYMGGIGFQQLCIFAFLGMAIRLHKKLILLQTSPEKRNALILLYVNYAVVSLVTVRIIFRLIEYSSGFESAIPRKEVYQYVLDSAIMMLALVLYNVFHPGRLMPGSESNLPSRKVRKQWKMAGQAPRGRVGQDYLLPKYETANLETLREASPSPDAALVRDSYAPVQTVGHVRDFSYDSAPGQEYAQYGR